MNEDFNKKRNEHNSKEASDLQKMKEIRNLNAKVQETNENVTRNVQNQALSGLSLKLGEDITRKISELVDNGNEVGQDEKSAANKTHESQKENLEAKLEKEKFVKNLQSERAAAKNQSSNSRTL